MAKKPGRVKLICTKCSGSFSTHSSNRQICYKCIGKCREIHYFKGILASQAKNKKEKEKALENKSSLVK